MIGQLRIESLCGDEVQNHHEDKEDQDEPDGLSSKRLKIGKIRIKLECVQNRVLDDFLDYRPEFQLFASRFTRPVNSDASPIRIRTLDEHVYTRIYKWQVNDFRSKTLKL